MSKWALCRRVLSSSVCRIVRQTFLMMTLVINVLAGNTQPGWHEELELGGGSIPTTSHYHYTHKPRRHTEVWSHWSRNGAQPALMVMVSGACYRHVDAARDPSSRRRVPSDGIEHLRSSEERAVSVRWPSSVPKWFLHLSYRLVSLSTAFAQHRRCL